MSHGIDSGHCGGVRSNDARQSYRGRRRRGAHLRPGLLLRGLALLAFAPRRALAQVTFSSIIVQNKNDKPGSFVLENQMTIDTVTFTWRAGGLSQRDCSQIPPGYDCTSRWGNNFFGVLMMTLRLTDEVGTELLPGDPSNVVDFTPSSTTLTGLLETDVVMTWVLSTPVDLPAGTYKIWDSDDLADHEESDNTGLAAYDVTLLPFTSTSSTTTTRSTTTSVTTTSATSTTSVTTATVSDTKTSVTTATTTFFPTQTTTPRYRPVTFNNIEVRNNGDDPGTLFLGDSITLQRVVFTYVSGSFTFSCPPSLGDCSGRWGGSIYGSPLMTLRLTDQQNNELLPLSNVVGFSPPLGLAGLAPLDDEMTWELLEPLYLDMGIYKIWDYMDLTNGMENTGSVVYHVSFVPFTTTTTTTSTETSTTTLTTTHTSTTLTSTTTATTTHTSITATSTTTMTSTLTSVTATSTTTITSTITSSTQTSTTGTSTTTMTSTTMTSTTTPTTITATSTTGTSTTTYTTITATSTTVTNTTVSSTTVTTITSSTTISATSVTMTTTSVTTISATTTSKTTLSTTWTTHTQTSTTVSNTTTTGTATTTLTTETLSTTFTNVTKRKRYVQVPESIADYYQATRYDENGTAIPRTSRCVQVPETIAKKFKARHCESDT